MKYGKPERKVHIRRAPWERLEVSRLRINGKMRIDIRIFRMTESGFWCPKSGLSVRKSEVSALRKALAEVVKRTPVLGEE